MRAIAPRFSVAEWGFAVGSPFWGTGLFLAGARMTLDFAFQNTAVSRLEARAVVQNGRGNGALRKLAVKTAGEVRLRGIARLRTLVVMARDAAGNRGVLRRRP